MTAFTARWVLVAVLALGCRNSDRVGASDHGAQSAAPVRAARLFAGGRRTCLVRGAEIRCWGDAAHGALGPSTSMSASAVPVSLPGIEGAVDIAFGEAHGCARMSDGSVRCWGSNANGELGVPGITGDSAKPVTVPGLGGATAIAAAGVETCATTARGIRCWGGGNLEPPSGLDATAIALGTAHACAIARDRTVACWGDDAHHQLGGGTVKGLTGVDEIAAGGDATCARSGGKVFCWGGNRAAQLGDPSMADRAEPRPIAGVDDAVGIALGAQHACAVRAGGAVVCWGGSDRGPFGYPARCPQERTGREGQAGTSGVLMAFCAAPLPVPGIDDAVALAHGTGHACALDRKGNVRCWGGEGFSELGNREHGAAGSKQPIEVVFATPGPRAAPQAALAVAVADEWSCAVLADHALRCWGSSSLGQLGPQVKEQSAKPIPIDGLGPVREVAMGPHHACALLEKDGAVRCWGNNRKGGLGDGSTETRAAPVAPVGLPPVAQLSVSSSAMGGHSCALDRSGSVWCWGDNESGEAHPGDPVPAAPTPAKIAGVSGATQILAGDRASCALVKGTVHCWGELHGPKDARSRLARPTRIAGVDRVTAIAMGYQAYCALLADRSVTCWGHLEGDRERRTLELGGPVRSIAISGSLLLAVLETRAAVTAWVDQDAVPSPVPVAHPVQVSCASSHCCALDENRRAVCWGSNGHGQLGDPDQGYGGESQKPVAVAL